MEGGDAYDEVVLDGVEGLHSVQKQQVDGAATMFRCADAGGLVGKRVDALDASQPYNKGILG